MQCVRRNIGKLARALIYASAEPARSTKTLIKNVVTTIALCFLVMDTALAVVITRAYADDNAFRSSEARDEMRSTADNDLVELDARLYSALHQPGALGSFVAGIRAPYSYWRLSDTTLGAGPPKVFRMTRRLRGPFVVLDVAFNGMHEQISKPLFGYDKYGRAVTAIPEVLVCRDGKYAKCNGAPPRVVGKFRI